MAEKLGDGSSLLHPHGMRPAEPRTTACKKCGGSDLTFKNGVKFCEHCGPQTGPR